MPDGRNGGVEWRSLDFQGSGAVSSLKELFGEPIHVASSFDDLTGALELVRQILPNSGDPLLDDEAAKRLVDWAAESDQKFKRRRCNIVTSMVESALQGTAFQVSCFSSPSPPFIFITSVLLVFRAG